MSENETLLQYLLFAMIDYEHLRTKKKKKKRRQNICCIPESKYQLKYCKHSEFAGNRYHIWWSFIFTMHNCRWKTY